MNKKQVLIVTFFSIISVIALPVRGQISSSGTPLFNPITDTTYVPVVKLEVEGMAKTKSSKDKSFKSSDFAIPVKVSLNTHEYGVWINYPGLNKKAWLLRIKSAGAQSLNLIFDKYKLNRGVKLFLYNKTQRVVLGAFSYKNNKSWESLATGIIPGEEIFIELQVPSYMQNFGDLNIGQVGIEKIKGLSSKGVDDRWYGASQACEVNVNCVTDPYIQTQKNAVVRIVYLGSSRCSGTLLNNLANNGVPYIITAGHCFKTNEEAKTAHVTFGYESPECESEDVPIQSISGATLVSRSDSLDFALLLLSEDIPIDYNPHYSGWDATEKRPQSTYILHHPEGDIRKITIDEDQPNDGQYSSQFVGLSHWHIQNYETGSTEAGSSGAGLVSDDNLLIGTLVGGGSACSFNINDYFQKFSYSYDYFEEDTAQLQTWLDPLNSNERTCLSLDVNSSVRNSAHVITNLNDDDIPFVKSQEQGRGYVSGHNYQQNALFAEHYKLKGSKYLYGANVYGGVLHDTTLEHKVVFTVWEGGSNPGKILYEKAIPIAELGRGINKIDFDSTLLVHNSFYFGYQIAYETDTFAVNLVQADADSNSAYTFIDNEWKPLQLDGTDYPAKLAIEVLGFDYLPVKTEYPDSSRLGFVNFYPNPSNDGSVQLLFLYGVSGTVGVRIFDIGGRQVFYEELVEPSSNTQIMHNLPRGVYMFSVLINDRAIETKQLVVL